MSILGISMSIIKRMDEQLAALRARDVEWKAAHAYLDESPFNDAEGDASVSLADRIAPIVNEVISLRARVAELESQAVTHNATLAPRQCNRLCFERGFEAGREAAFNAVDNYEIDVESPLFDAFVRRDLEIMTIIESLTAPSSCGCNPLKPSESDAAMLDEWHKRM